MKGYQNPLIQKARLPSSPFITVLATSHDKVVKVEWEEISNAGRCAILVGAFLAGKNFADSAKAN